MQRKDFRDLDKIWAQKNAGEITQAEYDEEKRKILARPLPPRAPAPAAAHAALVTPQLDLVPAPAPAPAAVVAPFAPAAAIDIVTAWSLALEFLGSKDVVGTKQVSRLLRAAARRALTAGRYALIGKVIKILSAGPALRHTLAYRSEPYDENEVSVFERAWALEPSTVLVEIEAAFKGGRFMGEALASFLSVVEPSIDGLGRITKACQGLDDVHFRYTFVLWCDEVEGEQRTQFFDDATSPHHKYWKRLCRELEFWHDGTRVGEMWAHCFSGDLSRPRTWEDYDAQLTEEWDDAEAIDAVAGVFFVKWQETEFPDDEYYGPTDY